MTFLDVTPFWSTLTTLVVNSVLFLTETRKSFILVQVAGPYDANKGEPSANNNQWLDYPGPIASNQLFPYGVPVVTSGK